MKNLACLIFALTCFAFAKAQELKKASHSIYFETDKYTLIINEERGFNDFVDHLDFNKVEKVTIYGYTDDVGSKAYNEVLSTKRAFYIMEYLLEKGVSQSAFKTVDGKGEIILKEYDDIETDIERGYNRKVLIEVSVRKEKKTAAEIDATLIASKLTEDVKIGDILTLEHIYFKTGYAKITSGSYVHLKKLATLLLARPDINFEVRGHVCCTRFGRDAIDRKTKKQNLSTARARFIYDYLAKRKISKSRMRYKGMRRKFPTGKGDEFDKRVEIKIVYINKTRRKKVK